MTNSTLDQIAPPRREPSKTVSRIIKYVLGFVAVIVLSLMLVGWRVAATISNYEQEIAEERKRIESNGYPFTLEQLNDWTARSTDEENAANYYREAGSELAVLDPNGEQMGKLGEDFDKLDPSEPVPSQLLAAIEKFVSRCDEVLAKLDKAASIDYCHYEKTWEFRDETHAYSHNLQNCHRLLLFDTVSKLHSGNTSAALERYIQSFALIESMRHDYGITPQMIRVGSIKRSGDVLRRLFAYGALTPRQRERLASVYPTEPSLDTFWNSMAAQRAYAVGLFNWGYSEGLRENFTDMSEQTGLPVWIPEFVRKSALIADKRCILAVLRVLFEEKPASWTEINSARSEMRQVADDSWALLAPRFGHSAARAAGFFARSTTECRLARIAWAIEDFRHQNGAPPDNLDALVPQFIETIPIDPFDGEQIRYAKRNNGYVIYSVFDNLVDDGGKDRYYDEDNNLQGDWIFEVAYREK